MSAAERLSSRSRRILERSCAVSPENHEELNRLGAETSAMTRAARKSCDQSAEQIRQSRAAIARSLQLLGMRFLGGTD